MTDPAATAVYLSTPGDMLASIPSMLGFRPEDSLVLLCADENNRVQVTLRVDLPAAEDEGALAAQICQHPAVRAATRATAVVVSERDHASLLNQLASELARLPIPMESFHLPAFTTGARWHRPGNADTGSLPDPGGTVLAAHRAANGDPVYTSRDDIAATFAPDDPVAVTRRAQAIDATLPTPPTSEQAADLVRAAVRDAHRGALDLTDQRVAHLAISLSDPRVRDSAVATAVPATTELARAARELWTSLTRVTPEPERAQPAALAGYAAYIAGDGIAARTALDIARAADPGHILASLLLRALDFGVHPAQLASLAHHDDLGLRRALDNEGDPATAADISATIGDVAHRR